MAGKARKFAGGLVIVVSFLFILGVALGTPSMIETTRVRFPGGFGIYLALGLLFGIPSLAIYGGYRLLRRPTAKISPSQQRQKWEAIAYIGTGIVFVVIQIWFLVAPPLYTTTGPESRIFDIIGALLAAILIVYGIRKFKRVKANH